MGQLDFPQHHATRPHRRNDAITITLKSTKRRENNKFVFHCNQEIGHQSTNLLINTRVMNRCVEIITVTQTGQLDFPQHHATRPYRRNDVIINTLKSTKRRENNELVFHCNQEIRHRPTNLNGCVGTITSPKRVNWTSRSTMPQGHTDGMM